MITVVLVDDHTVIRAGLRSLLEEQPDIKVVGEADNGSEGLKHVKSLRPDVLVVDLVMPGINGIDVTRAVSRSTAVVVLSMYGTSSYVQEALRAGAKGYVLKKSSANELVHAVRQAAAGKRYLGEDLAERVISQFANSESPSEKNTLTARETEVLGLIAGGMNNAEIASALFVSRRTVEFHRTMIKRKLGLANSSAMVEYCVRYGIAPLNNGK